MLYEFSKCTINMSINKKIECIILLEKIMISGFVLKNISNVYKYLSQNKSNFLKIFHVWIIIKWQFQVPTVNSF